MENKEHIHLCNQSYSAHCDSAFAKAVPEETPLRSFFEPLISRKSIKNTNSTVKIYHSTISTLNITLYETNY